MLKRNSYSFPNTLMNLVLFEFMYRIISNKHIEMLRFIIIPSLNR